MKISLICFHAEIAELFTQSTQKQHVKSPSLLFRYRVPIAVGMSIGAGEVIPESVEGG